MVAKESALALETIPRCDQWSGLARTAKRLPGMMRALPAGVAAWFSRMNRPAAFAWLTTVSTVKVFDIGRG